MNETNQKKAKKLHDVAAIFHAWETATKEGEFKDDRDAATKLIQEGMKKAASIVPLINEMVSQYELLDHDPNPPHKSPHTALHFLKQKHIGIDQGAISRHYEWLIKQVSGEEPGGFIGEYVLLAGEMIRWAERLETEKAQAGLEKKEAELTDTESNILEALADNVMTGPKLLKKAGYDYSSHYRGILSNLCKRNIIEKTGRGYKRVK